MTELLKAARLAVDWAERPAETNYSELADDVVPVVDAALELNEPVPPHLSHLRACLEHFLQWCTATGLYEDFGGRRRDTETALQNGVLPRLRRAVEDASS